MNGLTRKPRVLVSVSVPLGTAAYSFPLSSPETSTRITPPASSRP